MGGYLLLSQTGEKGGDSHMSAISAVGSPFTQQSVQQTQSQLPSRSQSGTKIDRDGDFDNSTAAADAAEGKGKNVNLLA